MRLRMLSLRISVPDLTLYRVHCFFPSLFWTLIKEHYVARDPSEVPKTG
jgi:hypothetical protein